jgi:hypothetical protein
MTIYVSSREILEELGKVRKVKRGQERERG